MGHSYNETERERKGESFPVKVGWSASCMSESIGLLIEKIPKAITSTGNFIQALGSIDRGWCRQLVIKAALSS